MTTPKTEHILRKHGHHPLSRAEGNLAATAPETQSTASATMIEACDRLAQKLDDVAALVKDQMQAWQQMREPGVTGLDARPHPVAPVDGAPTTGRIPSEARTSRRPEPVSLEIEAGQDAGTGPRGETGPTGTDGKATTNAGRLIETLTRSQQDSGTQAADLQQALEAIMDYLEGQAAAAGPKVDVAEIMGRLRNLEEEQRNLSAQFNTNRWGPS